MRERHRGCLLCLVVRAWRSVHRRLARHDRVDRRLPAHVLVGGQPLYSVHEPSKCAGEACCIHNPSDHHMRTWPQHWRGDRRIMERLCPHGVGHPDPDGQIPDGDNRTHGCDGCCRP